jgi:hypothetical protein
MVKTFSDRQNYILDKAFSGKWISLGEVREFGLAQDFGKAVVTGAGGVMVYHLLDELFKYRRNKISESNLKTRLLAELKDAKNRDQIVKELVSLEKDFDRGDGYLSYEDYVSRKNKIINQIVMPEEKRLEFSERRYSNPLYDFHVRKGGTLSLEDYNKKITADVEDARKKGQEYISDFHKRNQDKILESNNSEQGNNKSSSGNNTSISGDKKSVQNIYPKQTSEDRLKQIEEDVRTRDRLNKELNPKPSLFRMGLESAVKGTGGSIGKHMGDAIWYLLSDAAKVGWRKYQEYRNKNIKEIEGTPGSNRDKHISNLYKLKDAAIRAETQELESNKRELSKLDRNRQRSDFRGPRYNFERRPEFGRR